MYETNEYPTQGTTYASRSTRRRKWLAASGTLAAALILLLVIVAANHVRSNQASAALEPGTPTATPSAEPTGEPAEDDEEPEQAGSGTSNGGTNPGVGNQGGSGGGGQGSSGGGGGDDGDTDDGEELVAPLSIQATVNAVAPGGHCSASGTITVSGGEYPLWVKYQWRRLVIGGGWDGVAASAAQSHTFDEPGGISVQTNQLPEDGTNVFLLVIVPKQTGSGVVEYDGCSGQPGGGTIGS
jgi:hypothetical protein